LSDRTSSREARGVLAPINLDAADIALALAVGRNLFLWAPDPMLLTQADGVILDANPAACQTLGLSLAQIRARDLDSLRDQSDRRWSAALRQRTRTGRFVGEISMLRADGTVFPAEVSSSMFDVGSNQYAVLIMRDVSERKALEERLRQALHEQERLAISDDLTALLNRRGFLTIGRQVAAEAQRAQHPLVVLLLDVNRLKQVNDEFGHAIGDQMLRDVASVLKASLRTADVIARIGGDEFAVVLTGLRASAAASWAVHRIGNQLAEYAREAQRSYTLTVSIGLATGGDDTTYDLESLLRQADDAMYEAKREIHS
jgi:diguanylate cyclase (GGDEF)-like protein/PAS domain S-box-containing protein